jgi:hypothetical protein
MVTCYALRRPDGKWALLVVNKDPHASHTLAITFSDRRAKTAATFSGPVDAYVFSSANYVWHPHGAQGYARPNQLPTHRTLMGGPRFTFTFPPYSLVVLRGRVAAPPNV